MKSKEENIGDQHLNIGFRDVLGTELLVSESKVKNKMNQTKKLYTSKETCR